MLSSASVPAARLMTLQAAWKMDAEGAEAARAARIYDGPDLDDVTLGG